jgi:hypothetical protein
MRQSPLGTPQLSRKSTIDRKYVPYTAAITASNYNHANTVQSTASSEGVAYYCSSTPTDDPKTQHDLRHEHLSRSLDYQSETQVPHNFIKPYSDSNNSTSSISTATMYISITPKTYISPTLILTRASMEMDRSVMESGFIRSLFKTSNATNTTHTTLTTTNKVMGPEDNARKESIHTRRKSESYAKTALLEAQGLNATQHKDPQGGFWSKALLTFPRSRKS